MAYFEAKFKGSMQGIGEWSLLCQGSNDSKDISQDRRHVRNLVEAFFYALSHAYKEEEKKSQSSCT